jgi:benzoyl-CoA reductase subunit C
MNTLSEWVENRHDYAREWKKRTGGKVVGYFCSYLPEEILYAANILPVRIFSAHQPPTLTEAHVLSNIACTFCRDCLDQGLKGVYDYLDGLVMAQTCLHTGQMFWIWSHNIPLEWSYFMPIPHSTQNPGRFEYLRGEIKDLQDEIEKWLGKSITNEDLDRAIEVYNTNRQLSRQVYEFRKKADPPITGTEALELVMSSQFVDKDEQNQVLKGLLEELPTRKLDRETGTRLMIAGSVNDDLRFMRMVEEELSLPATFVIEETCTGLRYFFNDVTPQEDRLMAISIRYNYRPRCPHKDWPRRTRFPYIQYLLKEYSVEAVILEAQKFCHPHQTDNAPLSKLLRDQGIPVLSLEFDVTLPYGQFSTRVEAMLESVSELVY